MRDLSAIASDKARANTLNDVWKSQEATDRASRSNSFESTKFAVRCAHDVEARLRQQYLGYDAGMMADDQQATASVDRLRTEIAATGSSSSNPASAELLDPSDGAMRGGTGPMVSTGRRSEGIGAASGGRGEPATAAALSDAWARLSAADRQLADVTARFDAMVSAAQKKARENDVSDSLVMYRLRSRLVLSSTLHAARLLRQHYECRLVFVFPPFIFHSSCSPFGRNCGG